MSDPSSSNLPSRPQPRGVISVSTLSGGLVLCICIIFMFVLLFRIESGQVEQSSDLEDNYGIQVTAKALCADGMNTILVLQTDLKPQFWQLHESEFPPQGKTYYETSISFLENNELYSSVLSGKREEPVFDAQTQNVSTIQRFIFPQLPLPNSEFTINAKVTLSNLPESYIPPTGVNFTEPGVIEIPMEFVEYATIGACP